MLVWWDFHLQKVGSEFGEVRPVSRWSSRQPTEIDEEKAYYALEAGAEGEVYAP